MILHISTADKFILPFMQYNERYLSEYEHRYIIIGKSHLHEQVNHTHVFYLNSLFDFIKPNNPFFRLASNAHKIILHGLLDIKLVAILKLHSSLLHKTYWYIWGRDLYAYRDEKKGLKHSFKEWLRKPVIENMGHLITYVDGEIDLAREWYKAKGEYHVCYMYESNLFKPFPVIEKPQSNNFSVLAGHSADPLNNHFELFKILSKVENQIFDVQVPLSYGGSKTYVDSVINYGEKLFGKRFKPLLDFVPLDKYVELLNQTDVGVFNHKRQMAMGNIISLIGLGKKVYLRSDQTHWNFFTDTGISIFDIESLPETLFNVVELQQNIDILKSRMNKNVLQDQLRSIYSS
ncbi:hypothetical protein EP331_04365 [bacterium]|nr:MAG: hypothetical protein EP331_04365 [bacterium]